MAKPLYLLSDHIKAVRGNTTQTAPLREKLSVIDFFKEVTYTLRDFIPLSDIFMCIETLSHENISSGTAWYLANIIQWIKIRFTLDYFADIDKITMMNFVRVLLDRFCLAKSLNSSKGSYRMYSIISPFFETTVNRVRRNTTLYFRGKSWYYETITGTRSDSGTKLISLKVDYLTRKNPWVSSIPHLKIFPPALLPTGIFLNDIPPKVNIHGIFEEYPEVECHKDFTLTFKTPKNLPQELSITQIKEILNDRPNTLRNRFKRHDKD